MFLYLITNTVNGKVYVGKTQISPPERRWKAHVNSAKREPFPIHNAILKHGVENFKFEVIAQAFTLEGLNELEKRLIYQFESTNREKGYNLKLGGDGGEHTPEVRAKISAANAKRVWKDESKRKLGESRKRAAVYKTPEFRAKMRALFLARQRDAKGKLMPCQQ